MVAVCIWNRQLLWYAFNHGGYGLRPATLYGQLVKSMLQLIRRKLQLIRRGAQTWKRFKFCLPGYRPSFIVKL